MAKPPRSQRSIDTEQEEQRRRGAYLRFMSAQRAAMAGQSGRAAEREQVEAYRALGVDLKAGFEGRPPAFSIIGRDRTDSGEVLIRAKNIGRDPVRILWNQGALTKRQYVAAVALTDLLEQQASIGVRGMAFSEFVDGGKAPDVSTHALSVARKMAAWEAAFSDVECDLLTSMLIGGQTISHLARSGRHGRSRDTVRKRVGIVLERLADYMNVPMPRVGDRHDS